MAGVQDELIGTLDAARVGAWMAGVHDELVGTLDADWHWVLIGIGC